MADSTPTRLIHGTTVHGLEVDAATRCAHYHGATDIIAIRFHCCGRWYPCHECHQALASHAATVWPQSAQATTRAVLCGACGYQLSVSEYLDCDARCPACRASFNPGCARHRHLYFE